MRALVTGGAGFIGGHLVDALQRRGHSARVLDLQPPRNSGVDFLQGSILDASLARRAVADCAWVFHVAALPSLWLADKSLYDQVNRGGTETLLAAARAAGVARFLHTSSEVVFRAATEADDERDPPRLAQMSGPYARSKLLAERAVLAAAAEGFPALVVNPTVPLGPGDVNLTPPAQLLLDLLRGRVPAYLQCRLSLVDARDVAEGHVLAAERGQVGQRYLLAGEALWFSELLTKLAALSGRRMPHRRVPYGLAWTAAALTTLASDCLTRRPPQAPLEGVRVARLNLAFDSGKARRALGYSPRPLEATLLDTLADFQRRGLLPQVEVRRS